MDYQNVASQVLTNVGDASNVVSVMTCLTRLRLNLKDPSLIKFDALREQQGVLGVVTRTQNEIEVVFGPSSIESIAEAFEEKSGIKLSDPATIGYGELEPITLENVIDSHEYSNSSTQGDTKHDVFKISAGHKQSYRAQQQAAIDNGRLVPEDISALKAFLDTDVDKPKNIHVKEGKSVLVINGPNINMLGTREPNLYGKDNYTTLVRVCKGAAIEAGFKDIKCFQSNHEGAIVDEIQSALGAFDGIVINPAAYTHTSVAILDAVKAVQLPCIEVHISKVEEREDFRQVSYIRKACFETITGLGLEGYRKAILDLAKHLGM